MRLIRAIFHSLRTVLFYVPIAYAQGIWFLIAHPIRFMQFVRIFQKHERSLDEVEAARQAGYFNMSRQQRRQVARNAQKMRLL